jgi:outer membrane protein assembly factor BamB
MESTRTELKEAQKDDASVGFSQAPAAAKLNLAADNIGQANVKSVWAYQGARPCIIGDLVIMVHGNVMRAVSTKSGQLVWERIFEDIAHTTRPITPPAFAGKKIYCGTADGYILCMDPLTGNIIWKAKVGGHMIFEPAVAGKWKYLCNHEQRCSDLFENRRYSRERMVDVGWISRP